MNGALYLVSERDVLCDRQVRKERRFLVNNLHSEALRGAWGKMGMRFALQNKLAFIGCINAGQDFYQGALAATVLSRQTVDFRPMNRETDVGEGAYPAKTLADPAHLDEVESGLRGGCFVLIGRTGHSRVSVVSRLAGRTNEFGRG